MVSFWRNKQTKSKVDSTILCPKRRNLIMILFITSFTYHFFPFLNIFWGSIFFWPFLFNIWFTKELVFLRPIIWRGFISENVLFPNFDIDMVLWADWRLSILTLSGMGSKLMSLRTGLYCFFAAGSVYSKNLSNLAICYSSGSNSSLYPSSSSSFFFALKRL